MQQEILTVGGVLLTHYGAKCAVSLLAGLLVCLVWMQAHQSRYSQWIRLAVCLIPTVWFFSRLFYAFSSWVMIPLESVFDLDTGRDPMEGFYFWKGGYSMIGAVAGASSAARLAARWMRIPSGRMRDFAVMGIPAAVLGARLAEIGTDLGLGRFVTAQWWMNTGICPAVDGEFVHPVYLYEAAASVVLMVILLMLWRQSKHDGERMDIFLLLFGLSQVILESLKADGHMVEHFVHIEQVYAIMLAVWVMIRWSGKIRKFPGRGWKVSLCWLSVFAAAGIAIWAEFGVDRWGKPMIAYMIMGLSLTVIGISGFRILSMTKRN